MFNYRSGQRNVRVLRRIWYVGDNQTLRSRWVRQRTALPVTRMEGKNVVVPGRDTPTLSEFTG
jgi:hypothetical protein